MPSSGLSSQTPTAPVPLIMSDRFAIYYAPARDSALWRRAEAWLAQPDLQPISVSARRYGFHATIKAPMALAEGTDRAGLEMALADFARTHGPVALERTGGDADRGISGADDRTATASS